MRKRTGKKIKKNEKVRSNDKEIGRKEGTGLKEVGACFDDLASQFRLDFSVPLYGVAKSKDEICVNIS